MKKLCFVLALTMLVTCFAGCGFLKKETEVVAYIDETLSEDEARSLATQINMIENVAGVVFVSREEALEDFLASHEDETFQNISAEDLRHRFCITLADKSKAEETVKQIEEISGIADVQSVGDLLPH